MAKPAAVLKAAPSTTLEAYARVLDIAECVAALRTAGASELHPLGLPAEALTKLVEAHQALLAAHRAIEQVVLSKAL